MKVNPGVRTFPPAQLAALHLAFCATGIVTGLLGPLLPEARSHLNVTTGQIAALFTAQYAAGAAGALFSQYFRRLWVVAGLLLSSAGLAWFASAGWPKAIAAWALVGFGVGAAIPATNMLVAHCSSRRAAAVNLLNFVWGAGAAVSPMLFVFTFKRGGYAHALLFIAVLTAVVALIAAAALRRRGPILESASPAELKSGGPEFVPSCIMLFLYIGVETTLAGWLPTHSTSVTNGATETAGRTAFWFWASLMGGRAVFSAALMRLRESATLLAVLIVTAIAIALQMVATMAQQVVIGAAVAGLACAPIFALLLSRIATFAESRQVATPGWVFSIASLGGATLPWLFGRASEHLKGLHLAFGIPFAACVALILLTLFFRPARDPR